MAEPSSGRDPFESIISVVAGPIAAVIRSFDQLRHGADELLNGLQNFNRTMANLNETAERVNALLNDLEAPVRTVIPQVMRTVRIAESLADRLSGPVDQVVPGLTRLADTLNSPVIATLPTDLSAFVDAVNDLVRRLSPLGQLAESAGGLFGGLRLPGIPGLTPRAAGSTPTVTPPTAKKTAAKKTAAKQPAKKSARRR